MSTTATGHREARFSDYKIGATLVNRRTMQQVVICEYFGDSLYGARGEAGYEYIKVTEYKYLVEIQIILEVPEDFDWSFLWENTDSNTETSMPQEAVPVIAMAEVKPKSAKCPKCSGTGYIEAYRHRSNGQCYRCSGSGRKCA